MNNRNQLKELKTQASLLCKQLRSDDTTKQTTAAKRFLQLPFLRYSTVEKVLADIPFYQLKHAYWVLAIEHGYSNWNALRTEIIRQECMYSTSCGVYLNVWCASYKEAEDHHQTNGGYLLQYQKHYFIATEEVIHTLGLAHLSKEWKAIGYNWVAPRDKNAWNTLFKEAKKLYLERMKNKPKLKPIDRSKHPEWLKT